MKRFFLLTIMLTYWGCSTTPLTVATIRIKGSDTMHHLTELLAREYMINHPGVSIYVEGGGTASGVRSMIRGEADICTASRTLGVDEIKLLAEQFGSLGISFLIAKDALSIYLNPENPVNNISIDQLKKIYTCEITNWQALGGPNQPVIPITRTPNSGTYLYFKEHILDGGDFCESVLIKNTVEQVIEEVEENKNAIGFAGIGMKGNIKIASINGIEPTEENVRSDKYPISRYLHFYTLSTPSGVMKDFIAWVLSPAGQKIVKDEGYISLWEISY